MNDSQTITPPGILTNETNYLANLDILYFMGYRYKNVENRDDIVRFVHKAYKDILYAVPKFKFDLVTNGGWKHTWKMFKNGNPPIDCVIEKKQSDDMKFVDNFSRRSFSRMRIPVLPKVKSGNKRPGKHKWSAKQPGPKTQRKPFGLRCVINPNDSTELTFFTLFDHVYADARSADLIFSKFIEYLNALVSGDKTKQSEVLEHLRKVHTPDFDEFCQLMGHSPDERKAGLAEEFETRMERAGAQEEQGITYLLSTKAYNRFKSKTVSQFWLEKHIGDILPHFENHGSRISEVESRLNASVRLSSNSKICAIMAKAFARKLEEENNPVPKKITIGMVMRLGEDNVRDWVCGNYVIVAPVDVNPSDSLIDIALSIHEQIQNAKSEKKQLTSFAADLTMFGDRIPDEVDAPVTFYVTNWSSYNFANTPSLDNADAELYFGFLNQAPIGRGAANCFSKPSLIICNGPGGNVYLSMAPPFEGKKSIHNIFGHFDDIVKAPC